MKRLLMFLWFILFMSGCVTPPTLQNTSKQPIRIITCVYPEKGYARISAPDWVCNPTSVKGLSLAVTGVADNETNNQRQIHKCEADGRRQLAQTIETTVLAAFYQDVTETDNKLTSRVKITTQQTALEKLSNVMVHKWSSSPSGTIYCLIGMSSSQEQEITQKLRGIVQEILNSNRQPPSSNKRDERETVKPVIDVTGNTSGEKPLQTEITDNNVPNKGKPKLGTSGNATDNNTPNNKTPREEPNKDKPKPRLKKKFSVKLKQSIPICAKGSASIQHQKNNSKNNSDCTPVECRRRAIRVAEMRAMGKIQRLRGSCLQSYSRILVKMGAISEDTQLVSCEGTVRASTMPIETIKGDEVIVEYCGEVVEIKAQTK